MLDRYNRKINYLRISVTDRCNLRCRYCMPESGIKLMAHKDILSYDEITEVAREAARLGVNKIRITGGEPLVRRGLTALVGMIAKIDGIKDIGMTTNGILLPQFAMELKQAGLHRVNISLDSMDPEKYKAVTRVGNIEDALKGIDAALEVGLIPVKLNCVVKENQFEPEAQKVRAFADKKGLEVRFIPMMDLHEGTFGEVIGGSGGHCTNCNRLRLTASGMVKPCLFSDLAYDVREFGIERAYHKALGNKPKAGGANTVNRFSNIGG